MSNPPNNFNTNTNFNKFKGTYFNSDVDCSGGNIICRTGNLYLAPNSSIYSTNNTIEFDDVYYYINIPNNFHVLGQHKLLYNSVDYDVGYEIAKIQPIIDNQTGTMSYYAPSDFNIFNNIYCAGQIQYLESGTGNHIDLVPIVLDNKSKLTNISFDGTNTTTISGLLTLPVNSINSTSIINSSFCDLTNAQTIGGAKRFSANVRFDSALLVNAGATTISNTALGYISTLSSNCQTQLTNLGTRTTAVETKTTPITYTSATTTTLISGVLQFSGTLNGWSTTNFSNAINYAKDLTSSAQTQINTLTTNSVSTSASNIFTGLTNQFSNTLRLDGALNLNANALIIPNTTLQKLQYISTISSDIQTQTTTNATNITTANNNITNLQNNSASLSGNNTFTGTTNKFSNVLTLNGGLSLNNGASIFSTTQLQDIGSINDLKTKTTGLSWVGMITGVTGILATSEITFNNRINDVTDTVFNYLKNVTSDIQQQLNNLSSSTLSPVGTIISHVSSNLATTTSNKYLLCDGSAVSRTTFSQLFNVISTNFGSGDGSTTFNLPNYQGCFLRGQGSQTQNGVVYSSATNPYTFQPDQTQNHTHGGSSGTYLINSYQTPTDSLAQGYYKGSTSIYNRPASQTLGSTGYMNNGNGGTSTHPANYSVYYYIKT